MKNELFSLRIKSMTNNSNTFLINSINRRNIQKPIGIYIKTNKFILRMLHLFQFEGLINNFHFTKMNLIYIKFQYVHYVTFWKKLKFFIKNSYEFCFSFSMLRYFVRNSNTVLYFSTSKGILSTDKIFSARDGGFIMLALYN